MRSRAFRRGPTARDLSRLALARASSRLALASAREVHAQARFAAFRAELAATVRHVSPFLMALLEDAGITLDALAREIRPAHGWPDRPKLPAFRQFVPAEPNRFDLPLPGSGHVRIWNDPAASIPEVDVMLPMGIHLRVCVVDHSIEVAARIGAASFVSLFGLVSVRVATSRADPAASIAGCRLEDVVDLPACLRRGWIVARVADVASSSLALTVRTGVRRRRLRIVG